MFSAEQLVRKFIASSSRLYTFYNPEVIVNTHYMELAKSVINYSLHYHRADFAPYWIYLYDEFKLDDEDDGKIRQAIFGFGESMFGKEGRVDNCHFKFCALLHFATIGASLFLLANEPEKASLIESYLAQYIENEVSQWWNSCGRLAGLSSHCKINGPSPERTEAVEKMRFREARLLVDATMKPAASTSAENVGGARKRRKIEMEDLLTQVNSYTEQSKEENTDTHSAESEIASSTVSTSSNALNREKQIESNVRGWTIADSASLFQRSDAWLLMNDPHEGASGSKAPIEIVTLSDDSDAELSQ